MWDIKLGDFNNISYTMDQFIHMRLFLVVNIQLMTYDVLVYLTP